MNQDANADNHQSGLVDMGNGLQWLSFFSLVALTWGWPAEARLRTNFSDLETVDQKTVRQKSTVLVASAHTMVSTIPMQKQLSDQLDVLLTVEGELTDGDTQLDDGSLHDVHIFKGEAGQIIRISLASEEFDTFLLLQDASGEELARNDDGSDGTNSEILFRLSATGQYRILANALDESGRGTYRLTAEQSDEDTLRQTELKAEANRMFQQGSNLFQSSQYQSALDLWQSALKIYRELGDRQGVANSIGDSGSAYFRLGDYPQAISFYQQSLELAREIGDRQGEVALLGNLGLAYDNLGNYSQAIDFHQQSLTIAHELEDHQSEVASLNNLGLIYHDIGEYPQAIDLYQKSLSTAREIGFRRGEASSLNNLGNIYRSIGDYPQAIDFYQQSLAIKREIEDHQGEADSLNNLGNVYDNIGDYSQAVDFHQQSLAIAREIEDRQGESASLNNLGNAYDSLGDYPQAIDFYQQSLAIAHELGDRQSESASLNNLGNIYSSLGNYPQGIDFYQQSLAIKREIGDHQGEADSLGNLGFYYLKKEDISAAVISLFNAVSIFDSLRASELSDRDRINLFETQTQAYTNLVQALILQNRYSEALEISERGRTRSLVQLLSGRLAGSEETQALAGSLSFSDMQNVSKTQQSVLVEYSIVTTPDDTSWLYIWIMQPTGKLDFRQVPLGDDPARLSELVRQSRRSIGVRGRGFLLAEADTTETATTDKLRELHQLMIVPIVDLLPSDPEQQVVFIPQGDLFLVPFSALVNASGEYLIEQHTMLTAPSIQVLDLTRKQAMASTDNMSANLTGLLAVGNPVMPEVWNPEKGVSAQLSPLIGAEQEANAVADFFNTEALLGAEATEAVVKQQMGNARIIHLATHGLLEYGTPEESGVRDVPGAIALTPTQDEDGLLTSAEILELDLQADLVVLSACDTGLGTITGDGVIGLSRSLIAAGLVS